ncbi:MAG: chemotaxis protein [Methylomonas sp.]|nr:chemotaxis protein [Methylomonas sp.]PPD22453.1 MAG: chemotaxis protein [Methylomonas sp.]PPD25865.1 MAG: chemotaxis protein [Methylomonas sp.]PPD37313.1 MAG: chemotaxis protein [Methylomonas sp.]PPD42115.1 MAG: chemotaxis protein [Methylomonas sp.]
MQRNKSQFVAVASIAAELSAVMEVAKEISLAAANAKAIAFRAGEKAKGFQPITDFINELAKETIQLVNDINEHALKLYRLTVQVQRTTDARKRFEKVSALAESATHRASLSGALQQVQRRQMQYRRAFNADVSELLAQLADVMHPARAARVIAANSRIEASQAGEYLQSLQAVAESVDHAAQIINDKVNRCRSALSAIRGMD